MSADFKTLSRKETEDWLNSKSKPEPYKYQGHSFRQSNFGKQYCDRCGLVALNNPISQWCVDKGCNHEDHPQYASKVRKLTKQKWQ